MLYGFLETHNLKVVLMCVLERDEVLKVDKLPNREESLILRRKSQMEEVDGEPIKGRGT